MKVCQRNDSKKRLDNSNIKCSTKKKQFVSAALKPLRPGRICSEPFSCEVRISCLRDFKPSIFHNHFLSPKPLYTSSGFFLASLSRRRPLGRSGCKSRALLDIVQQDLDSGGPQLQITVESQSEACGWTSVRIRAA